MSEADPNLEEFVEQLTLHQVDLIHFLRTLTGDVHAAMDIRQVVNMVLWKKRAKFQPGTSFRNWAFRVAQLEVKKYFRTQRRSKVVAFNDELIDLLSEDFVEISDELQERRQALSRCVSKLTPRDLQLIRHRYWSTESLEVLAQATNRSVGTLKARLHQIRSALRTCIERRLSAGT
ncbi:sigma-70 family RNA polymerase sigma factor [Luteolibacter marinus]|uniref:sigma-70 family RNA polymerase sigma factor n=1 Tax=Luteolibacter marinus TaxID=2776705 RepID=UPI001868A56A|nr:sigma-70 family RNA polymerase sigma factor [Luteolibacter marinus]